MSLQVEWLLPDRRLDVPDDLKLGTASARLIEYTGVQPSRTLVFEQEAKNIFDSYSVMFNTRVSVRRKKQDADAAAEEGLIVCRRSHRIAGCCIPLQHAYVRCTYTRLSTCLHRYAIFASSTYTAHATRVCTRYTMCARHL